MLRSRAGKRRGGDRRRARDHRGMPDANAGVRIPGWSEQRVQFLTRYLFVALGLLFFNRIDRAEPAWRTLTDPPLCGVERIARRIREGFGARAGGGRVVS